MKCWNCGLGTMSPWEELGEGWFKCSNCAATFVKVLRVGPSPVSIEYEAATGLTKYKARSRKLSRKAKK